MPDDDLVGRLARVEREIALIKEERLARLEAEVVKIKETISFKLDALTARVAQVEIRLGVASIIGMAIGQVLGRLMS